MQTVRADAAIVLESTQLDVVVEHGGFAWFELVSTGVEAAGDDTDNGRDAIALLGAALSEVAALDRRLAAVRPSPTGGRARTSARSPAARSSRPGPGARSPASSAA